MKAGRRRGSNRSMVVWLVTMYLVLWVMVVPSAAVMQSVINISNNGTVYWGHGNDGALGILRVTTLGLGASTGALSSSTTLNQDGTLTASGTVSPLFAIGSVKRTSIFNCTLPGLFDPAANGGNGSWTLGAVVISGFGDSDLGPIINAGPGIPGAQTGINQYGFGTSTPTTSLAKGSATPADGFTLTNGQCVIYVLDSTAVGTPGSTLSGAGASAGFMDNGIAGTVQAVTGKADSISITLPTTTSTTTTTTTTTSTTSTTTTTTSTTEPPPTIPTTGEWGMMIFAAALLGFMAWMIQARRSAR